MNKKIQIIPVDFQVPWEKIRTNEEYEKKYADGKGVMSKDRDSTMAKTIEKTIKTKSDKRNCFFIVGMNHARKASPDYPVKAGTLIAERLQKENVFSILTHTMIISNTHGACGQLRYGLYDKVFEKANNEPVAFDLRDSPFGQEPFDAIQEIRFEPLCGNYESFYDGYIFLSPLKEEEYDYTLYEIFTDDFIKELKRRSLITNSHMGWYDIPREDLTKEKIVKNIKADQQKREGRRWPELQK